MSEIAKTFLQQSKSCGKLGSPFMERLMRLCGERLTPGGAVADHIFGWQGDPSPNADSVPLRLAGALHMLKRGGNRILGAVYPPLAPDDDAFWAAIVSVLETEADQIIALMASPPQTNEVRRSVAIIPALHVLAAKVGLPIHLSEVGASAGLNLRADQFRLHAGPPVYGPADAQVVLTPDWDGPAPAPAPLTVVARDGVDLNPLDPARDAARLFGYLWPDQADRIARTEAAIATAAAHPATLARGDAVDWLESALAPVPGCLRVLFHTIAWQYLSPEGQRAGDEAIAKAGAAATDAAPLARVAMEADGRSAALHVQLWPGGARTHLAQVDYHGRWITWLQTQLPQRCRHDTRCLDQRAGRPA